MLALQTGDISGEGKDQLIIIGSNEEDDQTVVTKFSFPSATNQTLTQSGKHICTSESDNMTTIEPCFMALIPSPKRSSTCDLLSVSLKQKDKKCYISFHVHERRDHAKDPFYHCGESDDYLDPFYGNPNYFHIKWQRCEWEYTTNAVMQLYSWYGVLAMRVFAPTDAGSNKNWNCVGLVPYMGQTSIGAGLGCAGDWGHGYMTWGNNQDFVDINEWVKAKGTGCWGIEPREENRSNIRGYEVERRPH